MPLLERGWTARILERPSQRSCNVCSVGLVMGDKAGSALPERMHRQAQDVGVGVGRGLKAEWEELSVSGARWSWSLLWMSGSGAEGASWRQAVAAAGAAAWWRIEE